MLVMIFHYNGHIPGSWRAAIPHVLNGFQGAMRNPFTEWLRSCAWVGVDIFFVLSGFLVSGPLLKQICSPSSSDFKLNMTSSSNADIRTFLVKRGLRILPVHYTFVILALLGAIFTEE